MWVIIVLIRGIISVKLYRLDFCQEAEANPREEDIVGRIENVLDFVRNQYLEIPFIVVYRREYVLPELDIADLWKVYKWDEKVN